MNPKTLPPTVGQKESEKKGPRLQEVDDPKPKRERKKSVVRIYQKIQQNPQTVVFKPVTVKNPLPHVTDGAVEFDSTQKAVAWARKNLIDNNVTYQIVTVQREFTIKTEQVVKVTMES